MTKSISLVVLCVCLSLSCCNFLQESDYQKRYDLAISLFDQKKYNACLSIVDSLLSKESKLDLSTKAKSLHLKGYTLFLLRKDPALILPNYLTAVECYKKTSDKKNLSIVYANLGNLFFENFSFELALDYFTKANEYANKANYEWHEAAMYYGMGKSYRRLNHYDLGMENLTHSLLFAQAEKDFSLWANNKIELGNLYFDLEDYDQAIEEYIAVAELLEEHPELSWYVAQATKNVGYGLFEKQDYKEAKAYFEQSLAYDALDSVDMAGAFLKLGQIAMIDNRVSEGVQYIKRSIAYNTGYLDIEELGEAGKFIMDVFEKQQFSDNVQDMVVTNDLFEYYTKKWKAKALESFKQTNTLNQTHREILTAKQTEEKKDQYASVILIFLLLLIGLSLTSLKLWQHHKKKSKYSIMKYKKVSDQNIADLETELENSIEELNTLEKRNARYRF